MRKDKKHIWIELKRTDKWNQTEKIESFQIESQYFETSKSVDKSNRIVYSVFKIKIDIIELDGTEYAEQNKNGMTPFKRAKSIEESSWRKYSAVMLGRIEKST